MSESAATVIYLPCDVVPVRARIAVGDGLSPLEKIVLRAIDARPCTGGELADLLGLGDRLTVDVLHGLWRYGHLRTDFGTRTIHVSEEIRQQIAEGRLDTVAGIDTEEIQRDLMIEKLTGHVLPPEGHPSSPPTGRLAVDHPRADLTFEGASQTAVAAALNQSIDVLTRRREARAMDIEDSPRERAAARTGGGRHRRVQSILATPRGARNTPVRRWLAVEVLPKEDRDTGRLVITVADRAFPADRRQLASRLLTQLAADYPGDGFVSELRKAAAIPLREPPPLRDSIHRLATDAARTAGIPAGQRRSRHLELCDEARRIEGMLDSWICGEVTAELISGGDQHLRTIDDLIRTARRQLVVVSPQVGEEAVGRLEEQLRAKIRADVRVVLLWGREYDARIPEGRASNIVNDLCRERASQPMLRPLVSARTEARMVIADDRAALVTSHGLLASGTGQTALGMLVRPAAGENSQLIRDLLERVRMIIPDGRMSRQLAIRAEDFTDSGALYRRAVPHGRRPLPEEPPDDPGDDPRVAGAVAAWTTAWTGYARDVTRALEARSATVAMPVADGDHHELLWRALRTAARRLVIASGRLGAAVCNTNFLQAIAECAARGVAVTISYGKLMDSAADTAAAGELDRLAADYPDQIRILRTPAGARVLVWDDEAVVGSFEYLSLAPASSADYLHRRSRLSLRVSGPVVAASVAAAVGAPATEAPGSAAASIAPIPSDDGRQSTVAAEAAAAAQRIRNQVLAGNRLGEILRAEIDDADDPWAVLDALMAAHADATASAEGVAATDDVITGAAAYCLVHYAGNATPLVLDEWRRWLIGNCWEAGRFVEAAVLRAAYPVDDFRPRPWLTVLAASRGGPQFELALVAAEDIELLAAERPALLAAAVVALLTGSEYARSIVTKLVADTSDVWAELALASLEYQHLEPGRTPRQVLHAAAAPTQRDSDRIAAWAALDRALDRAGQVPVTNAPGRRTHFVLFGQHGVFGQIAEATARRDVAVIGDAVAAASTSSGRGSVMTDQDALRAVAAIVDRTWAEVAPNREPLQAKRRERYLDRLAGILISASTVLELADGQGVRASGMADHYTPHQEGVNRLARRLAVLCADATAAAVHLPAPEARLVRTVIADLTALVMPDGVPERQ